MKSLVLEVQTAAVDPSVAVSDLLRMAKTLSVKLNVRDLEEWIDLELKGYRESDVEIPPYRFVHGSVKLRNPWVGWIQADFHNQDEESMFSKRGLSDPITFIESIVANGSGTHEHLMFPAATRNYLRSKCTLPQFDLGLEVSRSSFKLILDTVRDTVLDWSLALESKGVLGEGMTFSTEDMVRAATVNHNTNVTNNIGTMTNSQLQQASDNSSQTQTNIDFGRAEQLAEDILKNIERLDLEKDVVVKLNGDLDTIKNNLRTADPDIDVIRPAFRSARNILEGAAGSALATSYATEISAFLGSIPNLLPA